MNIRKKLKTYAEQDLKQYENPQFLDKLKEYRKEKFSSIDVKDNNVKSYNKENVYKMKIFKIAMASLAVFAVAAIGLLIYYSNNNNLGGTTVTELTEKNIPYRVAYADDASTDVSFSSSRYNYSTTSEDEYLIINSYQKLLDWSNESEFFFTETNDNSISYNDNVSSRKLSNQMNNYDESFFESNSLLIIISYSEIVDSRLTNVSVRGNSILVNYSRISIIGFNDKKNTVVNLIEVSKKDIENTNSINVNLGVSGEAIVFEEYLKSIVLNYITDKDANDIIYYFNNEKNCVFNEESYRYEYIDTDYVASPKKPIELDEKTIIKIRRAISDICYYHLHNSYLGHKDYFDNIDYEYLGTYNGFIAIHIVGLKSDLIQSRYISWTELSYHITDFPIILWKEKT